MSAPAGPVAAGLVQVRRFVPARPHEVYRAWTEPELVQRWFKPRGGSSAGAEMDVRVGGSYRWGMKLLGHVYYAVGEYIAVEPPHRLVFTFGWERTLLVRLTDSLVTVDLADLGDRTEVVITHERLADRGQRVLHGEGWRVCLRNIERLYRQMR